MFCKVNNFKVDFSIAYGYRISRLKPLLLQVINIDKHLADVKSEMCETPLKKVNQAM